MRKYTTYYHKTDRNKSMSLEVGMPHPGDEWTEQRPEYIGITRTDYWETTSRIGRKNHGFTVDTDGIERRISGRMYY